MPRPRCALTVHRDLTRMTEGDGVAPTLQAATDERPLVTWIWVGVAIIFAGGLTALSPRPLRARSRERSPVPALSGVDRALNV
jgi:hypothetical protein